MTYDPVLRRSKSAIESPPTWGVGAGSFCPCVRQLSVMIAAAFRRRSIMQRVQCSSKDRNTSYTLNRNHWRLPSTVSKGVDTYASNRLSPSCTRRSFVPSACSSSMTDWLIGRFRVLGYLVEPLVSPMESSGCRRWRSICYCCRVVIGVVGHHRKRCSDSILVRGGT